MRLKKIGVIISIISFILFMSIGSRSQLDTKKHFHTKAELDAFGGKIMSPIGPGEYFHLAFSCKGYHGTDSAAVANINEDGIDVNLFDHWESTMMANSAR